MTSMSSTIQVTVDDELRKDSDKLFKSLGTDTTSAIRMFLKQSVMYQGFPFEIRMLRENPYQPLSEDRIYEKLEKSRRAAEEGRLREYSDIVEDMRSKYGL